MVDDLVSMFVGAYQSTIPAFVNGLIADKVRVQLNEHYAAQLAAPHACPAAKEAAPASWATLAHLGTAIAGSSALLLTVIVSVSICLCRRRGARRAGYTPLLLNADGPNDGSRFSLAVHPSTGWVWALGVPAYLLANIFLFISSNTSAGATVTLQALYGNQTLLSDNMFVFSLGNSIHDMWVAKVYFLSGFIALFSGAWPYTKLLMMLYAWVSQPGWYFYKGRESFLMVLDMLGKLSLIDAYVLVMMMIAFHLDIELPSSSLLPDGPVSVRIIVEPNWGFYGFLMATMTSLVMSHLILAKYRRVEHPERFQKANHTSADDEKETLRNFHFGIGSRHYYCTGCGQLVVVLMIVGTIGLILAGTLLKAFTFEFKGAIYLAMNQTNTSTYTEYSVFDVGMAIPGDYIKPKSFGIHFIQVFRK
jgi:hypothetical protein